MMKNINKVVVLFLTIFASFATFASEMSSEFLEKIANELKNISKNEKLVIEKDEVLEFELGNEIIEVDIDLIKELEKRGMLEKGDVVARDGARCIR